jgi:curved DNA-binding protein CbpA
MGIYLKNYYDILGLKPTCTTEEVKTAYRKLALKYHPDQNPGDVYFEQRFIELNEAYQTLSIPQSRRVYDRSLNAPPNRPKPLYPENPDPIRVTLAEIEMARASLYEKAVELHNREKALRKQEAKFAQEKRNTHRAYLYFYALAIVIIVSVMGLYNYRTTQYYEEQITKLQAQVERLQDLLRYR